MDFSQVPRIPDDAPFNTVQRAWLDGFMAGLYSRGTQVQFAPETAAVKSDISPPRAFSRENPFPAPLLVDKPLCGPGSAKDTRHFEIGLEGSGLAYEVGDALGVWPTNSGEYVEDLLKALGYKGDEAVPSIAGGTISVRDAFSTQYDITKTPRTLIEAIAEKASSPNLKRLLSADLSGDLANYLWGREIIDLILEFPAAKFTPTEFVTHLKKLAPRLYSIASSLKAHPGQVHLTVAIVRYESHGRKRKGVCSTFLAERTKIASPLPVFIHSNKNFRLPADGNRPVIMIGPGTGIAPFRAFLEERKATGAKGRNWLFFGDQKLASDFLYKEEFEAMLKEGTLSALDLAFSRDQVQKIYVQHRMVEKAKELFAWLEEGAYVYVCGDASRMAKDVNDALQQVIQTVGGRTSDDALAYIQKIRSEKRYQRDVY